MPFTDQLYYFETTHQGGVVVIHEPGNVYEINSASLGRKIKNLREMAAEYSADEYQSLMTLYRSALRFLEQESP